MYYPILLTHSWLRWVALALSILVVLKALSGWLNNKSYTSSDNRLAVFYIAAIHTQFVLGLVLYFWLSPKTQQAFKDFGAAMKNTDLRVWAVEHLTTMLLAVIFAQVARTLSKKAKTDLKKHKQMAIYASVSLVLLLIGIPWTKIPMFRF